jgi:hypothetical protein
MQNREVGTYSTLKPENNLKTSAKYIGNLGKTGWY